jgi:hypothetical protein
VSWYPLARITGITSASANRKQCDEVRLGGPFQTGLVDLHGLVLGTDNLGTRHGGEQAERINEPPDGRDHITLDLRLVRLAFPVDGELAPVHMDQSRINHGDLVGDLARP